MNENINLVEILKDCPKGTKLYSPIFGNAIFQGIKRNLQLPICVTVELGCDAYFSFEGKFNDVSTAECCLFPSKDQRDWSKFKAPIKRFDPKTFQPFDKVLVRGADETIWVGDFFSYWDEEQAITSGYCRWRQAVLYNAETKHLLGTTDEAPEYYKWWEK